MTESRSRLDTFRAMVAKDPDNALARYAGISPRRTGSGTAGWSPISKDRLEELGGS
jgi:hypothetical protein